jgi:hypothetical protein
MKRTFLHALSQFGLACLTALVVSAGGGHAATPDSRGGGMPDAFLQQHCLRCHDAKTQEGQLRIDTLSRDFASLSAAAKWAEVMTRINAGEMPPEEEPRPTVDEIAAVVGWISGRIEAGEAARMAARGPVASYRLSREEYAHTIDDLLGIRVDPAIQGGLLEDSRWHGFERVGAVLSLAPAHVERYLKMADDVLELAFPEKEPTPTKRRIDAHFIVKSEQPPDKKDVPAERLADIGLTPDQLRIPIWPGRPDVALWRDWWWGARQPGVWRGRLQLSGMPGLDGRAPHATVLETRNQRTCFDQDIIAAEDRPIIVEIERDESAGDIVIKNEVYGALEPHFSNRTRNSFGSLFTSSRNTQLMAPDGFKLTTEDGRALLPLLLVDWVEWEGPLVSDAQRLVRKNFYPATLDDQEQIRDCLHRFAEQAWRRPVADVEIAPYVALASAERQAGEKPRKAYLSALAAVLASKNFYFLEEGSPTERRDRLTDNELASRLSYFLWSSLPDEPLFAAARGGKLHERAVLAEQLSRMQSDPKFDRFMKEFPRQWLQLHRVGMFQPDVKLYPQYDRWLEKSMVLETVATFRQMVEENLPLRELFDSNWTMINPRLAEHYGLQPPATGDFTKVTLRPEDHRGGLLTQAAVLSLSSDGTRHRPVHRGVWVSEAIFGTTPPPPPPNVEPLPATKADAEKATVRSQLAAHSTNAACAACHRKIDPLGLAFDNYDAIGRWRTHEKLTVGKGADPAVDASGVLPDGRAFDGPEAFKKLLAADVDRIAEAFVGSLATYALRRTMTIDDRDEILAIVAKAKTDDYRMRTLFETFILSDLFQKR